MNTYLVVRRVVPLDNGLYIFPMPIYVRATSFDDAVIRSVDAYRAAGFDAGKLVYGALLPNADDAVKHFQKELAKYPSMF